MKILEIAETAARMIKEVDQCDSEWDVACFALAKCLSNAEKEVLGQLCEKPVADGYVCSKAARDSLIEYGLAKKVMFDNQFGYTAATYAGGFVKKYIEDVKKVEESVVLSPQTIKTQFSVPYQEEDKYEMGSIITFQGNSYEVAGRSWAYLYPNFVEVELTLWKKEN